MYLRHQGGVSPYPHVPPSADVARPPRVLQLLPDDIDGLAAARTLAVATSLRAEGGDMVVAGGPSRLEAPLRRAGIDHRPYAPARNSLFRMSATQALLDTVAHRDISLIHVHGLEGGLAAKAFAEAANRPLIMTCESLPAASSMFARRAARKHIAGRPVIVRSRHAAECLYRDYGLAENEVQVIPPGLDTETFDERAVSLERKEALIRAWGIGDDFRPVVLVPGAVADPVWLNTVLAAATDPAAPDALWILVGTPEDEVAAEARIAQVAGLRRVGWVSNCVDWPAAYALSSLVVSLPRQARALCDHALAAQAMGRAVVTTDAGAHAEAILPGKTGWLVRPRDAGSLVYAVAAALDRDDIITDAMAMAARTFVRDKFSMASMQAVTMMLYRQVLASA